MADSFRAWLREAREGTTVSQSQLDEILIARAGKKAGYTAQLENGRVKAPDKSVCIVIAEALGRDPQEAWRVSALERMRIADVLEFHLEALDEQQREFQRLLAESRRKMTPAELLVVDAMRQSEPLAALIESVRELQERLSQVPARRVSLDLADALTSHLEDISAVASLRFEWSPDRESMHSDLPLWTLLHKLYGLPSQMPNDQRRQLLYVLEGATEGLYACWCQAQAERKSLEETLHGEDEDPLPGR